MVGDTANKLVEACSRITISTLCCVPKNTSVKINDLVQDRCTSESGDRRNPGP